MYAIIQRKWTQASILAGLFTLAACGGGSTNNQTTSTTTANGMDFTVSLMGTQVLPNGNVQGAAATATGTAMLHLEDATMRLTGNLSLDGLPNVTAVHLHSGYAGQDGGVVKALTSNGMNGYLLDAALTMENVTMLKAGGLYLNVHSGTGGSVQIRGQILPSDLKIYRAMLTAASSSVTTSATGIAAVTVNEQSGAFIAFASVKDLSAVISAAHIHNDTSAVAPLTVDANNMNLLTAMNTLNGTNLQALKNGTLYVNIHTQMYPTGEIKGTLMRE